MDQREIAERRRHFSAVAEAASGGQRSFGVRQGLRELPARQVDVRQIGQPGRLDAQNAGRFRHPFRFGEARRGFVEIAELLVAPADVAGHDRGAPRRAERAGQARGAVEMIERLFPLLAVHFHQAEVGQGVGQDEELPVGARAADGLEREAFGALEIVDVERRSEAQKRDFRSELRNALRGEARRPGEVRFRVGIPSGRRERVPARHQAPDEGARGSALRCSIDERQRAGDVAPLQRLGFQQREELARFGVPARRRAATAGDVARAVEIATRDRSAPFLVKRVELRAAGAAVAEEKDEQQKSAGAPIQGNGSPSTPLPPPIPPPEVSHPRSNRIMFSRFWPRETRSSPRKSRPKFGTRIE